MDTSTSAARSGTPVPTEEDDRKPAANPAPDDESIDPYTGRAYPPPPPLGLTPTAPTAAAAAAAAAAAQPGAHSSLEAAVAQYKQARALYAPDPGIRNDRQDPSRLAMHAAEMAAATEASTPVRTNRHARPNRRG